MKCFMKPHLWTLNLPLQYSQIFIVCFFLFCQGIYYVNIFSLFVMFFSAMKMYLHFLLIASIIAVSLTKLFHIT